MIPIASVCTETRCRNSHARSRIRTPVCRAQPGIRASSGRTPVGVGMRSAFGHESPSYRKRGIRIALGRSCRFAPRHRTKNFFNSRLYRFDSSQRSEWLVWIVEFLGSRASNHYQTTCSFRLAIRLHLAEEYPTRFPAICDTKASSQRLFCYRASTLMHIRARFRDGEKSLPSPSWSEARGRGYIILFRMRSER